MPIGSRPPFPPPSTPAHSHQPCVSTKLIGVLSIRLFLPFHINETIWSTATIFMTSYVLNEAYVRVAFLLIVKYYSTVWMPYTVLTHSPVEGHWCCLSFPGSYE